MIKSRLLNPEEAIAQGLMCGLCDRLLYRPRSIGCPRDHAFCLACISPKLQVATKCPKCPVTDVKTYLLSDLKPLWRTVSVLLDATIVKCVYHELGCVWKGPLSQCSLDDHLLTCPKRLSRCPFHVVGCTARLPPADIPKHKQQAIL